MINFQDIKALFQVLQSMALIDFLGIGTLDRKMTSFRQSENIIAL